MTDLVPEYAAAFHAQQSLRRGLSSDERLLWWGMPRQGLRLRAGDALLIPFSLMWGGFAIFWESMVLRQGAPLFMALWGIPFVLIGLYLIVGRFFVDARQRAKTYYGLTDQRVLIITGVLSRQTKSLPLQTLSDITLVEQSDGSGTITFGPINPAARWLSGSSWPGASRQLAPAFEMVEGAKQVYERIRQAQQDQPRV